MNTTLRALSLAVLTTLALGTLTSIAWAEQLAVVQPTFQPAHTDRYPSPFNLVSLAYQGYFKEQGTPASQALLRDYQLGQVTAEDVVKNAIQAKFVNSTALQDRSYLEAVKQQLTILSVRN